MGGFSIMSMMHGGGMEGQDSNLLDPQPKPAQAPQNQPSASDSSGGMSGFFESLFSDIKKLDPHHAQNQPGGNGNDPATSVSKGATAGDGSGASPGAASGAADAKSSAAGGAKGMSVMSFMHGGGMLNDADTNLLNPQPQPLIQGGS